MVTNAYGKFENQFLIQTGVIIQNQTGKHSNSDLNPKIENWGLLLVNCDTLCGEYE